MSSPRDSSNPYPPLGLLLREWRAARGMSQLDLALAADMSTRHLSCVETGKARPSREAIARIAAVFDMPLRERNALLLAAGHAPEYPEREWDTPVLERMRQAAELILAHQEPYPAFVLDRQWNVLMANGAAVRVNALLMDGRESRHGNLLHQVFDPADFRPLIVNWPEVAEKFLHHLHAQIAAAPPTRRHGGCWRRSRATRACPASGGGTVPACSRRYSRWSSAAHGASCASSRPSPRFPCRATSRWRSCASSVRSPPTTGRRTCAPGWRLRKPHEGGA